MPHIGFNLIYLVPGETGGMETYARELIPEVAKARPSWKLTAFVNRELSADSSVEWLDAVEVVTVPVSARSRVQWVRGEQQLLPRIARRAGVDLLHSLGSTSPAWGSFKRVTTIHDIHYKLVPDSHFGLLGLGMRLLIPLSAKRSDLILTDAVSTKSELVEYLKLPPEKIVPVPLGVRVSAQTGEDERSLREKFEFGDRKVLLTFSAKRPHKNLARLLEAFAQLDLDDRPLLVLPGYPTPHEEELRFLAERLGIASDVRFLGWISDKEAEGLYELAAAFVFPSLHEGFGLPVLEAMARGVPVACSNCSSLPEVVGNAALLFDPKNVTAIRESIESLLVDGDLAQRLGKAGIEQASRFTWGRCATGVIDCYERAL